MITFILLLALKYNYFLMQLNAINRVNNIERQCSLESVAFPSVYMGIMPGSHVLSDWIVF